MARGPRRKPAKAGYYAYDGLNRAVHEKARLGILTALFSNPAGLLFGSLKDLCALTDGNLSRHIHVLQEAELVEVWKGYEGRRPQTLVRLSKTGRKQFLAYLEELERVIKDSKRDARQSGAREAGTFEVPPGWFPA